MSEIAHIERKSGGYLRVVCNECEVISDWYGSGQDGEGAEAVYEMMHDHNHEVHNQ